MSESNWRITYVGTGVQSLGDVGVFARNTTASVTAEVAEPLKSDSAWQVTPPGETPAAPPPAAEPEAEAPKADAPKADAKKADAKKDDAKKDDAKKADAKKKG